MHPTITTTAGTVDASTASATEERSAPPVLEHCNNFILETDELRIELPTLTYEALPCGNDEEKGFHNTADALEEFPTLGMSPGHVDSDGFLST